ncbi:MAG: excinuclease ABC subunit UvrC [Candidatus Brocadiia bacterium]|nr:excinuclease ABC subunit UvrC [Candidatus Brocadiia bacterium]
MGENAARVSQKLETLPVAPGIYLLKDRRGEVLYVGKAKSLRARVRSYFQNGADAARLISRCIGEVADLDVVVAGSEKEALILECNFIKQFRPRYNVNLRDDKSFVSIKISLREPWPRPIVTRRLTEKDALYFGPYANAGAARQTVRVLQDIFPLRRCSLRQCREARRPCLYGQMGKCLGPCCEGVTEEQYRELVDQVVRFLRGKGEEVLQELRRQMNEASVAQQFERAARLRDRIRAIETTLEKQRVGSTAERVDRDVFGLAAVDGSVWVAALFVRGGNVQDAASYRFAAGLGEPGDIFCSFLNQFYSANRFIPAEVLLPVPSEDAEVLAEVLSERLGRRVAVLWPQRGAKRRLVELADKNAREAEALATSEAEKRSEQMDSLKEILGLSETPRVIECFDISTLQGREAVGSMVVFRDGEPDKRSYRHYRVRWPEGQDDFAMMHEVLTRRYRHVAEGTGRPEERAMPELTVVDGGKGQLSAALRALRGLGLEPKHVIALAKERSAGGKRTRVERVYLPGRPRAVPLPERSYGRRLLVRVRDEAHRFAVRYHRTLRRREALRSPLLEVPGVGPALAERLLDHFGGLARIKEATVEGFAEVKGVGEHLARIIHDRLHAPDQ